MPTVLSSQWYKKAEGSSQEVCTRPWTVKVHLNVPSSSWEPTSPTRSNHPKLQTETLRIYLFKTTPPSTKWRSTWDIAAYFRMKSHHLASLPLHFLSPALHTQGASLKEEDGVHIMLRVPGRFWVSFLLTWIVVAKIQARNDLWLFYETQTHLSNPTMQNSTN